MALTTLVALKLHMGIASSDTSEDAFLTQLLAAVEASFKKLTDRDIEQTTYTDYYSGKWTPIILLNEYPVISLTGVWLDSEGFWGTRTGSFGASTQLTEGQDFSLVRDGRNAVKSTGRLYRIAGVWPGRGHYESGLLLPRRVPGAGNVKATFVAGYATIPADIQLAIWQACAALKSSRDTGGRLLIHEAFEEYEYKLQPDTLALIQAEVSRLGTMPSIIARYKRITIRGEVYS